MSHGGGVPAAHAFIRRARSADDGLRDAIRSVAEEGDLDSLVRVANDQGFRFTPDELRLAFSQDWTMRWLRYGEEAP